MGPSSLLVLYGETETEIEKQAEFLNTMQNFYKTTVWSPSGLGLKDSLLMSPYQGELHRARVISNDKGQLTVLFLDYGNTESVSWWDCYPLMEKFQFAPFCFTVEVNIDPLMLNSNTSNGWSIEDCQFFQKLLNDLEELEVKQQPHNWTLPVDLYYRDKDGIHNLGDCMVTAGHALHRMIEQQQEDNQAMIGDDKTLCED